MYNSRINQRENLWGFVLESLWGYLLGLSGECIVEKRNQMEKACQSVLHALFLCMNIYRKLKSKVEIRKPSLLHFLSLKGFSSMNMAALNAILIPLFVLKSKMNA